MGELLSMPAFLLLRAVLAQGRRELDLRHVLQLLSQSFSRPPGGLPRTAFVAEALSSILDITGDNLFSGLLVPGGILIALQAKLRRSSPSQFLEVFMPVSWLLTVSYTHLTLPTIHLV